MSIADSKHFADSIPIIPASQSLSSPDVTTISAEGIVKLPDGRNFKIENLKIGDTTRGPPFTADQLSAIQNLVQKTFEESANLKSPDIHSYTIKKQANTNFTELVVNTATGAKTETLTDKNLSQLLITVGNVFRNSVANLQAPNAQAGHLGEVTLQVQNASSPLLAPLGSLDNADVSNRVDLANVGTPRTHLSTLREEYTFSNGEKRAEIITRDNTVDYQMKFLGNMITDLKEKGEKITDKSSPEHAKLTKDLKFLENQLDLCVKYKADNNGKDWADSNYFRDLIKKEGSFEKAINNYLSVPINMRYQEVQNGGVKQAGFFRVGIMSDMRNGWVSVADLETMKLKGVNSQKLNIEEKISEIKEHSATLNKKIEKLEKEPVINSSKIKKLEKQLSIDSHKLESANYALAQLTAIENAPNAKRIEFIDEQIRERKQLLSMQMIQLVAGQVAQNPGKIKDGTFQMAHVSLLSAKNALDNSGWVHSEPVEMEDMKGIFDEFNGYNIEFSDEKGPLVDMANKKLFLPTPVGAEALQGKEIKLKTFFFNTCVQGHKKSNSVHQSTINTEQFTKLDDASKVKIKDIDKTLEQRLTSGNATSYTIATDLVSALLGTDIALSIGCLSAKDRTGAEGAAAIQRSISESLPDGVENPHARDILNTDSLAVKVVLENTPEFHALKVDPTQHVPGTNFINGQTGRFVGAWFDAKLSPRPLASHTAKLLQPEPATATQPQAQAENTGAKPLEAKVNPLQAAADVKKLEITSALENIAKAFSSISKADFGMRHKSAKDIASGIDTPAFLMAVNTLHKSGLKNNEIGIKLRGLLNDQLEKAGYSTSTGKTTTMKSAEILHELLNKSSRTYDDISTTPKSASSIKESKNLIHGLAINNLGQRQLETCNWREKLSQFKEKVIFYLTALSHLNLQTTTFKGFTDLLNTTSQLNSEGKTVYKSWTSEFKSYVESMKTEDLSALVQENDQVLGDIVRLYKEDGDTAASFRERSATLLGGAIVRANVSEQKIMEALAFKLPDKKAIEFKLMSLIEKFNNEKIAIGFLNPTSQIAMSRETANNKLEKEIPALITIYDSPELHVPDEAELLILAKKTAIRATYGALDTKTMTNEQKANQSRENESLNLDYVSLSKPPAIMAFKASHGALTLEVSLEKGGISLRPAVVMNALATGKKISDNFLNNAVSYLAQDMSTYQTVMFKSLAFDPVNSQQFTSDLKKVTENNERLQAYVKRDISAAKDESAAKLIKNTYLDIAKKALTQSDVDSYYAILSIVEPNTVELAKGRFETSLSELQKTGQIKGSVPKSMVCQRLLELQDIKADFINKLKINPNLNTTLVNNGIANLTAGLATLKAAELPENVKAMTFPFVTDFDIQFGAFNK